MDEGADAKRRRVQEELARRVRAAQATIARPAAPRPRTAGGPAPLSRAQRRYWSLHRLAPDDASNSVVLALRAHGRLDVSALEAALRDIVSRHEILRSTFHDAADGPMQAPRSADAFVLRRIDLDGESPVDREAAARRAVVEEAQRPFDLENAIPFRAALVRLDPGDHVIVLVAHHIASDGWSLGMILAELASLYEARARGTGTKVAPPGLQYADFAAWEHERLAKGDHHRQELAYWSRRLAGVPPLRLPTDEPRPSLPAYQGATLAFNATLETQERLRAIGQESGATLFATLLAAFKLLLHRYTELEDVAVGTPVAGRTIREVEDVMGCFVNMLVLRADLSGDPTFRELIVRVRDVALEAFANQSAPIEEVAERVEAGRGGGGPPLFDVVFNFQNTPAPPPTLAGLAVDHFPFEVPHAQRDVSITMRETPSGLQGMIAFRSDIFHEPTIRRMIIHYLTIIEHAKVMPDAPISTIPLLSPSEAARLLQGAEGETAEVPDATLDALLARQAARTPEAVALLHGARETTFTGLDADVDAIAGGLQQRGVAKGDVVAAAMQGSPDAIAVAFGILRAGAVHLPVDPAWPDERLRFVLEDSGARLLVAPSSFRPGAIPPEDLRSGAPRPSPTGATSGDAAYLLYTSDPTGWPKGTLVAHGSAANLLGHHARTLYGPLVEKLGRPLRVALPSPLSSNASIEAILSLLDGHALVVVDEAARLDPGAGVRLLHDARVDLLAASPSLVSALLDEGLAREGAAPAALILGGDAIPPPLWQRLQQLPSTTCYNAYGTTECAGTSTIGRIRAGIRATIGRPIANVRAYVLDAHRRLVPLGVPGELHIAGACVALGYHKRPDLTAERFTDDPFVPGARMYRTGDVVRRLPDGEIEFVGRRDDQVKIGGVRIEPGEIEARLPEHPDVRECCVVARDDGLGARLVAYVASAEGRATREDDLAAFMGRTLPADMVPSIFVPIDALPRLPNGKVDRRALSGSGFQAHDGRPWSPRRP